jgi:hypothetical protein
MARELWQKIPKEFDTKGAKYQKYRLAFGQGITEYALAAANLPKFVGGIYNYRDHIGDPNGRDPFVVVPADKQQEALKYLVELYFSPNSFTFSPELLNKLAPNRQWDLAGTPWRRLRPDYPIHGMVQLLQASALFRLYDPLVLQRLQDNEIRFPAGEKVFTMAEMFSTLRKAVWQELSGSENIGSFRRELQRMHLHVLTEILMKEPAIIPRDAVTLARADFQALTDEITVKLSQPNLDTYTTAHLEETQAKLTAVLNAQIQKSF